MSTQNITTTDQLVATMVNLTSGAVQNLSEFAELTPALYAEAPWKDEGTKIGDFFTETFGIGSSKDGYITLPQIALDRMVRAFMDVNVKVSYADMTAMSGASRATVARAQARCGMSVETPSKNPNKGNSDNADNGDTQDKSDKSGVSGETGDFDLPALLSALDDEELGKVLAAVGLDRVKKLVNA